MKDILRGPRYFIGWRYPGNPNMEREVELVPAKNIYEPDSHAARAIDHIIIPEGALVCFIAKREDDDLL